MTSLSERIRALLANEGTQTLEWLDKELRKCVDDDDLEGVKNLLNLGASPAMNDGHGSTFYQSMDKSGAKSDAVFDLMLENPHTAQVINGTSTSWPPFATAMVAFRPDRARRIMNHPAYRFNHTEAPWQFERFVFKELGAEKHGLSQTRYEDEAVYADIKRVALDWFWKNGLPPPKEYWTKSVFTKSCEVDDSWEKIPKKDYCGRFDVETIFLSSFNADSMQKVYEACKELDCNAFVLGEQNGVKMAWLKRVRRGGGSMLPDDSRHTLYVASYLDEIKDAVSASASLDGITATCGVEPRK